MPLPLLPKILTYTFATAHAATGLAALLGEVDLLQGVLLDTAKARACSCIAPSLDFYNHAYPSTKRGLIADVAFALRCQRQSSPPSSSRPSAP